MATTVQQVLDDARARHWALASSTMPEGALVAMLNQRQRALVLRLIDDLEPLLNQSREIATDSGGGQLVAIDGSGVPYLTDEVAGYAVMLDADGVPYIDTSEPQIITDPFGDPDVGFPLPALLLRVTNVTGVVMTGTVPTVYPIDVVLETARNNRSNQARLTAFISGNRLVPVRCGANDRWSTLTYVQMSYVVLPTLAALTDTFVVPDMLLDPLIWATAELMATTSRECTVADRQQFAAARVAAEQSAMSSGYSILGDLIASTVEFRG